MSEGESGALDLAVEGARSLTLRAVCERVGGTVILSDARVLPTS